MGRNLANDLPDEIWHSRLLQDFKRWYILPLRWSGLSNQGSQGSLSHSTIVESLRIFYLQRQLKSLNFRAKNKVWKRIAFIARQKSCQNHSHTERYTKYRVKDTATANTNVTNRKIANPFQNNAELSCLTSWNVEVGILVFLDADASPFFTS